MVLKKVFCGKLPIIDVKNLNAVEDIIYRASTGALVPGSLYLTHTRNQLEEATVHHRFVLGLQPSKSE